MSTVWRVMLSHKLWDQEQYECNFASQPSIAQAKGARRMVVCPKKGDPVVFVIRGKMRMRGFVDSDGFVEGTDHQTDPCNIGDHRPHAEPKEFARVTVTEIGLCQDIRRTRQATWAKIVL